MLPIKHSTTIRTCIYLIFIIITINKMETANKMQRNLSGGGYLLQEPSSNDQAQVSTPLLHR